jgi:prevent-host-death family protein
MTEIGAFEAKNTLGGLLDRVERGEEITISRRGKPVARLVPIAREVDPARARAAADALRALAVELAVGGPVTLDEMKAWRDAGRPSTLFD